MSQLKANAHLTNLTVEELSRISVAFAKTQVFKNGREPMTASEIFLVLVAGQEMGIGPSQAIMGIKMIEGKPSLSANLMASMVKASGKYDYRVSFGTDEDPWCEVVFFDTSTGQDLGVSRFTPEMADVAGLRRPSPSGKPSNYLKYWRNMFFARALSNGTKWFVPDALMVSAYHEGEIAGDPDAPVPQLPPEANTQGQISPVSRETEIPDREPAVVPVPDPPPYHRPDEEEPETETEMEQMIAEEEIDYFEPATSETARITHAERDAIVEAAPKLPPNADLFDEVTGAEPAVTHESSEPTVSPAQIRLLHVRRKIAKLTEERFKEITVELCGTPHVDRIPKRCVNDLLERLDDEAKLVQS